MMKWKVFSLLLFLGLSLPAMAEDDRQLVEMPEMMQGHMLHNMRDHLMALNEILAYMAADKLDKAAEVAENRIGMSSLDEHGAAHMAPFMPKGMQEAGTNMHRAASRFALKAQEGGRLHAYDALKDITASCVACHSAYRIR
jgi:hypothetical protein